MYTTDRALNECTLLVWQEGLHFTAYTYYSKAYRIIQYTNGTIW